MTDTFQSASRTFPGYHRIHSPVDIIDILQRSSQHYGHPEADVTDAFELRTRATSSKHREHPQGGDVAQLVERRTGTPLRQVRFPGAARDFSPRVNFQCRLSYGVRTPPCAIAYCAHVKAFVAHVRVRWIMETRKHPACTIR